MAITHTEIRGSGEGRDSNNRDGSGQLKYLIRGDNALATVQAYVISNSLFPEDVIFGGRTMKYKDASWTNPAYGKWIFTGQYQEPDRADKDRRLDVNETRLSFDTSGGTLRVFNSKETRAKYPSTSGDYKTLIGVDREGKPEGAEIVIPALKITIRCRLAKASVDAAYVKTLASLTGTVNDASFFGFAADEMLFLGAQGEVAVKTDPEITFNFAASENITGLTIGDIGSIAKKGHDYIWIRYEDVKDAAATPPVTVQQPTAVYVERLYDQADWTAFGIGTSL